MNNGLNHFEQYKLTLKSLCGKSPIAQILDFCFIAFFNFDVRREDSYVERSKSWLEVDANSSFQN